MKDKSINSLKELRMEKHFINMEIEMRKSSLIRTVKEESSLNSLLAHGLKNASQYFKSLNLPSIVSNLIERAFRA